MQLTTTTLYWVLLLSVTTLANATDEAVIAAAEVRLSEDFHGVVSAGRGEQTVYEHAFGMADIAGQQPNTPETRFRIGSISKTFTAGLLVQLAEAGALSLDDRVAEYLPGVPNGDRISLRDLIEHRSGLRDFSQSDWQQLLVGERVLPADELLDLITSKKPKRDPGKKFEYNNAGYILLGLIIEQVMAADLASVFETELFVPLGLRNTGFAARDGEIPGLSVGHDRKHRADPADYNYSAILAAGGLYSTVADLRKWCAHQAINPEQLGWRRGERFGRQAAWHPGNTNDYSALLVQFPEVEGCYAVLSNVGQTRPSKDILRTIPGAIFGAGD